MTVNAKKAFEYSLAFINSRDNFVEFRRLLWKFVLEFLSRDEQSLIYFLKEHDNISSLRELKTSLEIPYLDLSQLLQNLEQIGLLIRIKIDDSVFYKLYDF